jgi:hypothetical protein
MKTTLVTPPPVTAARPSDPNRTTNQDHLEVADIPQLDALAWEIEDGGIAGRELAVRRVVRAAQALGVSPTLVAVLADPAEPEVARLRAFGCIATALAEAARNPHADGALMATAV